MTTYPNRPPFTPECIKSLLPDEVFVFGSNLQGHHKGGAARVALTKFGAIYGQGVGLQGQSYAIPTMQDGVKTIAPYVDEFINFTKQHPEKFFYVTRIGCGIAGFRDAEIAPLFTEAMSLGNVCLPEAFVLVITGKNDPIEIELSKTILDTFSAKEIIYAEMAVGGAMGCAGQAMIYLIRRGRLVCYTTSLFKDTNTYMQVQKMLLKYSGLDYFPLFDDVPKQRNDRNTLFRYFNGGMGNHVFINKGVTLEILDNQFVYRKNNRDYNIYCSVLGVFNSIAHTMKNSKKTKRK